MNSGERQELADVECCICSVGLRVPKALDDEIRKLYEKMDEAVMKSESYDCLADFFPFPESLVGIPIPGRTGDRNECATVTQYGEYLCSDPRCQAGLGEDLLNYNIRGNDE